VTRMTDDQLMKLIALKSKQEDLNMIDITPTGLSQISGPARTNS
jgi:hypothetical protein